MVLMSVVTQGGSPRWLGRMERMRELEGSRRPEPGSVSGNASSTRIEQKRANEPHSLPVIESQASGNKPFGHESPEVGKQAISLHELRKLQDLDEPIIILDVRTERSLETNDLQTEGAIRAPPEQLAQPAK